MFKTLNYTGKKLETKKVFTNTDGIECSLDNYNPETDLIDAVNLTLALKKRPLLLMGEPGCGKTRLAEAVAFELHKEKMDKHFFRWFIKSTSKANEGIYRFDALKRLYHANKQDDKTENMETYIDYGPLYKAFTEPMNKDEMNNDIPNVLLIDEIDKADIDFPNDLLLELENKEFIIPELDCNRTIKAKSDVIVFITSNKEKELPSAFLRRCLYHYIKFPKEDKLKEILVNHFTDTNEEAVNKAVQLFIDIRKKSFEEKKPATSELIDWFEMIDFCRKLKIEKPMEENRTKEENRLIKEYDKLDKKIPFRQLLFKTEQSFKTNENEF